ncbi:MAG: 3'(2'),5'-bisphosphate nucleotidase CysQ [Methylobacteriaceae bacterium]|nr:3'(2'),5'-bisphosphate nucleotidase CysQ [Methylobacteriaceae bacterium]
MSHNSGSQASLSHDRRALADLADLFARIAIEAGALVLDLYDRGCGVARKADASPVTEADTRAETLILERLARELPGVAVVAEETVARAGAPRCPARFILVDPLDGTREFLQRNDEFTVNIALIEDGAPVAGAVVAPAAGRLWTGGDGAHMASVGRCEGVPRERRAIACRPAPAALTALASRSHGDERTEAFLARLPIAARAGAGSSLKFCRIAEAAADVYPRFTPTMEWDTAAGQAVLAAAGGVVLTPDGAPFRYGKCEEGYRNGPFVAWGDPAAPARFR